LELKRLKRMYKIKDKIKGALFFN